MDLIYRQVSRTAKSGAMKTAAMARFVMMTTSASQPAVEALSHSRTTAACLSLVTIVQGGIPRENCTNIATRTRTESTNT